MKKFHVVSNCKTAAYFRRCLIHALAKQSTVLPTVKILWYCQAPVDRPRVAIIHRDRTRPYIKFIMFIQCKHLSTWFNVEPKSLSHSVAFQFKYSWRRNLKWQREVMQLFAHHFYCHRHLSFFLCYTRFLKQC